MEINKNKTFEPILNQFIIFAIFISILGFISDLANTFEFGGIDLRNRVVGARLLMNGLDPYFFKWNENMSELFLDPNDSPYSPVSKVTVPPTVLIVHSALAKIPYKTQRIIWFLFQWILFLVSLALFSKSTHSENKSKLIWIIGLLFISGSFFWRLHVEKGQIYILYVFLIAFAYWLSQKNFKNSSILSGFVIGFTASLRPPMIFMSIPMLIYRKWKLFIGNIIGFLFGIGSSLMIADSFLWKKYASAMYIHEKIHLGLITDIFGLYSKLDAEGMNNILLWANIPTFDSSFQGIFKRFLGLNLSSNMLLISLTLILLFLSFYLYKSCRENNSMTMLFLAGATLVFISEFFIPAARQSYSDVMWLIPLSLIIINCDSLSLLLLNPLTTLLFIGLIFSISFHLMPCSGLISDYAMLFYITFTTLLFLNRRFSWQ